MIDYSASYDSIADYVPLEIQTKYPHAYFVSMYAIRCFVALSKLYKKDDLFNGYICWGGTLGFAQQYKKTKEPPRRNAAPAPGVLTYLLTPTGRCADIYFQLDRRYRVRQLFRPDDSSPRLRALVYDRSLIKVIDELFGVLFSVTLFPPSPGSRRLVSRAMRRAEAVLIPQLEKMAYELNLCNIGQFITCYDMIAEENLIIQACSMAGIPTKVINHGCFGSTYGNTANAFPFFADSAYAWTAKDAEILQSGVGVTPIHGQNPDIRFAGYPFFPASLVNALPPYIPDKSVTVLSSPNAYTGLSCEEDRRLRGELFNALKKLADASGASIRIRYHPGPSENLHRQDEADLIKHYGFTISDRSLFEEYLRSRVFIGWSSSAVVEAAIFNRDAYYVKWPHFDICSTDPRCKIIDIKDVPNIRIMHDSGQYAPDASKFLDLDKFINDPGLKK